MGCDAHSTEVRGDVVTRVLFENGHSFRIAGSLTARARLGERIEVGNKRVRCDPLSVLVPSVLDENGELDEEKLYRRICDGKSILRERI